MRERASRIGAKLTITSSPESGTDIVVVVPAAISFLNGKPLSVAWTAAIVRLLRNNKSR